MGASAPSLVGHAPLLRGGDRLDIPVHGAARVLVRGRDPRRFPSGHLGLRDVHVDGERSRVDGDDVAVLHHRDRAAHLRLGRDVPHAEAVAASRETAVGDERHILAQPRPHDHRGGREHLFHARPTLGTLVPDHDDLAAQRLVVLDDLRHQILLGVEAHGGALEAGALLASDLTDGALGRKGALEDGDVPRGLDGVGEGADDVLTRLEAG
mmetsp:Transcript_43799/g.105271  ORF Transcript_43799/g.105271 Transcript_43799/m.105271 type:complete len:210 (+) Transcript_43799:236-865(+)